MLSNHSKKKSGDTLSRFQQVHLSDPFTKEGFFPSSRVPLHLYVIGGISMCLILILFCVIVFKYKNSNEMVCQSDYSSITITYDQWGLIGYSTEHFSYDFSKEQKTAKKIGIDDYLLTFQESFESMTEGTCKIVKKK